ncbi:MAG TPA: APC family permease, partial [Bacteroidia bacterium]|nr:APC family permease [Bacteroidia bacterium]
VGALLAYMDGSVWAELGASYPAAGGSYVFLQKVYGEKKWGALFSFLFIWQTTIQAPLVIASASIGLTKYVNYLVPKPGMSDLEQRMVSGAVVLLLALLLYRKITQVGKISILMGLLVAATMLWVIFTGFSHFHSSLLALPEGAFRMDGTFWNGLGSASTKTIYAFLGYYNVCHLGAEIKDPQKNIPKSIFLSVTGITLVYLLMQVSVLGAMPWQEAEQSSHVISTLFEKIYGSFSANLVSILIVLVGLAGMFSAALGYSRIPYAAAVEGNFFKIFARLHPVRHFPHVSLLFLCGIAFVFSLFSNLSTVITIIVVMRIPVQFVGQAVGLIAFRYSNKDAPRPWRMKLFPLPAILSILIWLFVLIQADPSVILFAFGMIMTGIFLFLVRARINSSFPFQNKVQGVENQQNKTS